MNVNYIDLLKDSLLISGIVVWWWFWLYLMPKYTHTDDGNDYRY